MDEHDSKWEKSEVDDETFVAVLKESIEVMDASEIPYLVMGGIASSIWGRPRKTQDVDFLVQGEDAERALEAFADAGFETRKKEESWLYKAVKNDVLVDVIFKSQGEVYLDEEMLARATTQEFKGQPVKVIPAEDLTIMKAIVSDEEIPHQWHDAVSILRRKDLDWDYLVRRSTVGARRILSLLVYGQSNGLLVPDEAIRKLFRMIYES